MLNAEDGKEIYASPESDSTFLNNSSFSGCGDKAISVGESSLLDVNNIVLLLFIKFINAANKGFLIIVFNHLKPPRPQLSQEFLL